MNTKIKFEDIEKFVSASPGIYEIYTNEGIALKVGIARDLLKRLKQHRASRQSGLVLKADGDWNNPSDVKSKGSILAKHLYFDGTIANRTKYDLRIQEGRQAFLEKECHILFTTKASRAEARELEEKREKEGGFIYKGMVKVRLP